MASEGANLGHAIACIAIAAYLRNRSIKSAVFVGNLSDGYQVDLKYTIREWLSCPYERASVVIIEGVLARVPSASSLASCC